MKASLALSLLIAPLLAGTSLAGFEPWTSSDGRSAELELVRVTELNGVKVGTFRMRDGRTTTLKASDLSEADAKRLEEWQSPGDEEAAAAGPESVFDEILDGNLVRLQGRSVKRCKDATKPKKYYVFYYTASWCGPCQKFTPTLVDFYNDNKNDNFELVLITSDSSEDAMEQYAEDKKMPWPMLELKEAEDFKKKFRHGVTGIPSVIVCDLEGENLGNFRGDLDRLKQLVTD